MEKIRDASNSNNLLITMYDNKDISQTCFILYKRKYHTPLSLIYELFDYIWNPYYFIHNRLHAMHFNKFYYQAMMHNDKCLIWAELTTLLKPICKKTNFKFLKSYDLCERNLLQNHIKSTNLCFIDFKNFHLWRNISYTFIIFITICKTLKWNILWEFSNVSGLI